MSEALNVLKGLRKILKAKAFYNPELKVIDYDKDTIGENFSCKRIFGEIVEKYNKDKTELIRVNLLTKPLINFSSLQGFLMEKFGGYQKI